MSDFWVGVLVGFAAFPAFCFLLVGIAMLFEKNKHARRAVKIPLEL